MDIRKMFVDVAFDQALEELLGSVSGKLTRSNKQPGGNNTNLCVGPLGGYLERFKNPTDAIPGKTIEEEHNEFVALFFDRIEFYERQWERIDRENKAKAVAARKTLFDLICPIFSPPGTEAPIDKMGLQCDIILEALDRLPRRCFRVRKQATTPEPEESEDDMDLEEPVKAPRLTAEELRRMEARKAKGLIRKDKGKNKH